MWRSEMANSEEERTRKMRIWGRYIDSIGVVEVLLEVGE
jgi:hypothetical protein